MNPVTGLSLGRIVIGAASVANPTMVTKAFGLDVEANPQTTFMTRLFGAREIALGAATLVASGRGRTGLVLLGVGVDGADAYAGYIGPKADGIDPKAGMLMTGVAGGAVLSGLLGLLARGGSQAAKATKATTRASKRASKRAAKKAAKKASKKAVTK